jgi:hypothetical protein
MGPVPVGFSTAITCGKLFYFRVFANLNACRTNIVIQALQTPYQRFHAFVLGDLAGKLLGSRKSGFVFPKRKKICVGTEWEISST